MRLASFLVLLTLAVPATVIGQAPAPGSEAAKVALGKRTFEGRGLCFSCHGMKGEGVPAVSANTILADGKWLHSKGTHPELVALITAGIDAKRSKSGVVMPARGGSRMSDREVDAVAAYVVELAKQRAKK